MARSVNSNTPIKHSPRFTSQMNDFKKADINLPRD